MFKISEEPYRRSDQRLWHFERQPISDVIDGAEPQQAGRYRVKAARAWQHRVIGLHPDWQTTPSFTLRRFRTPRD